MPRLVATNKSHIRTNNTAKYSFFFLFFFSFFVKTYWEKEKKKKIGNPYIFQKFEIEAIFRTIDEETQWHWCNIHNALFVFNL